MLSTNARQIKERKVVRRESFPEDIDGRLTAVLSSVNTEPKQVELMILNNYPKTRDMLKREFDDVTSGNFAVAVPSHKEYCDLSFVPIGLVCNENVLFDGSSRWIGAWSINDAGEHYGKPIAAFALKKAIEYGTSFFEILGKTASSGESRSPYNRLMIMELLTYQPLRSQDLADALNLDKSSILLHAKTLKDLGFADYASVGSQTVCSAKYEWLGKDPEDVTISYRSIFSKKVANVFAELKVSDANEISVKLGVKDTRNVNTVIHNLEKMGLVKRVSKFKVGEILSEMALTDFGKYFWEDCGSRFSDALKDGDSLKYMRSILDEYQKKPDTFIKDASRGVLLYREVSPLEKSNFYDRCRQIYDFLTSQRDGLNREGILDALDHKVSGTHFNALLNGGYVTKERKGQVVIYRATNPEQSISKLIKM